MEARAPSPVLPDVHRREEPKAADSRGSHTAYRRIGENPFSEECIRSTRPSCTGGATESESPPDCTFVRLRISLRTLRFSLRSLGLKACRCRSMKTFDSLQTEKAFNRRERRENRRERREEPRRQAHEGARASKIRGLWSPCASPVIFLYVLLSLASPTPAHISNDPATRLVTFSNLGLRAVLSALPASCPYTNRITNSTRIELIPSTKI